MISQIKRLALAGLLVASNCAALPSPANPDLNPRQVVSGNNTAVLSSTAIPSTTSSSTTSGTLSSTSASSTATSSGNGTSLAELLGIPVLSADTKKFIESGQVLAEAGLKNVVIDGSLEVTNPSANATDELEGASPTGASSPTGGFSSPFKPFNDEGPNTPAKWNDNNMDLWLQAYVLSTVMIDESGKKYLLADSPNFLTDFWISTGEEKNFLRNDILGSSDYHDLSYKARKDLTEDDRQRALFVRQCITVWHEELKRSYSIFDSESNGMQSTIYDIRNAFVTGDIAKPGDPADVLFGAVAAIGALIPAIGPAASMLSGAYALGKAIKERDDHDLTSIIQDAPLLPRQTSGPELEGVRPQRPKGPEYDGPGAPQPGARSFSVPPKEQEVAVKKAIQIIDLEPFPPVQKEEPKPEKGQTVKDINERVKELEKKLDKEPDTIKTVQENIKRFGDFLDKTAKVVTAWKAMYPNLPKAGVDTWSSFDTKTKDIFDTFWKSVADSFDVNKVTFYPSADQQTKSGRVVGAKGMQQILARGAWSKVSTTAGSVTATRDKLKALYKDMVLAEVLRAQSIYIIVMNTDTQKVCDEKVKGLIDSKMLDSKDGQCEKKGNSYEIRIPRRPMKNLNSAKYSNDKRDYRLSVKLGGDPKANNKAMIQFLGDFQAESATVPIFSKEKLDKVQRTASQVYSMSDECHGDRFFKNQWPSLQNRYPAMVLNTIDLNDINTNIRCLYNLPILKMNDAYLQDWCISRLGHRNPQPNGENNMWLPNKKKCEDLFQFGVQGDYFMCMDMNGPYKDRTPIQGCDLHDNGYQSIPYFPDCYSNYNLCPPT